MTDESHGYSWDDFKADQRKLRKSAKTHCVLCGAKLVNALPHTGKLVCPNGCTSGAPMNWDEEDISNHDHTMDY